MNRHTFFILLSRHTKIYIFLYFFWPTKHIYWNERKSDEWGEKKSRHTQIIISATEHSICFCRDVKNQLRKYTILFTIVELWSATTLQQQQHQTPRNNAHFFLDQFSFFSSLAKWKSISTAYNLKFIIVGITFCRCCRRCRCCSCYRFYFSYISNHIYRQFIFIHLARHFFIWSFEQCCVCAYIYITLLCFLLFLSCHSFHFHFFIFLVLCCCFSLQASAIYTRMYSIVSLFIHFYRASIWLCCLYMFVATLDFSLLAAMAATAVFNPPLHRRLHNWLMFI